jgi:hypothetical protein
MCIWTITMIEAIEKEVSVMFTSLFVFRQGGLDPKIGDPNF